MPLRVSERSATTLSLAPAKTLRPGRYAFVVAHEGMFGGRDYDYLTVVSPSEPVTAIASNPTARAPAVADAVLPVATVLVALLFAFLLARSYRARPAGQKAFWALGFALFAAAAACEAAAQRTGWSPGLFRAYYLCGGVLTVAYLGAGSAWLKLRPRARDVLLGALAVATAAARTSSEPTCAERTRSASCGYGFWGSLHEKSFTGPPRAVRYWPVVSRVNLVWWV